MKCGNCGAFLRKDHDVEVAVPLVEGLWVPLRLWRCHKCSTWASVPMPEAYDDRGGLTTVLKMRDELNAKRARIDKLMEGKRELLTRIGEQNERIAGLEKDNAYLVRKLRESE